MDNETPKIFRDFEIQTDYIISVRRQDLVIIKKPKKRTCFIVDLAVSVEHWVKIIESEKRDKYLDFVRELKKTVVDCDTSCNWCTWNGGPVLWKESHRKS